MPLSEHPTFPRFNWSIVPDANHDADWQSQRVSAPGANAGIKRQSRPYWSSDLSGCQMNEAQKDEFLAMKWRCRGIVPVLMRVAPFCEIGTIVDRDAVGNPVVEPSIIGQGNGTLATFQLKKRLPLPG